MDIHARLNNFALSPRKVRLVTDTLKGMPVSRALVELEHRVKRAAGPVRKLLQSAIANAANNFQVEEQKLFIKEIRVDAGRVLKRSMPRAFGRAAPIRKRSSSVILILGVRGADVLPRRKSRTESSPATQRIREVEPRELKGSLTVKQKGIRETEKPRDTKKSKGFVKRIFQRKAI